MYTIVETQVKIMSVHDDNSQFELFAQVDIDDALLVNVRQLEKLALYYHSRGDYDRAQELSEAVIEFRRQAKERQRRENESSGPEEKAV
jgi:hypothetical protein